MMNDQGLPASVDAEKTVLGAILIDNEYFFDETAELEGDDFSLDAHRRIYRMMNQILFGEVEGVTTVDPVTLCNELQRQGEIEAVGGWAYIASLTDGLPRKIVLGNYIRILKEKTKLRKIMLTCNAAYARAQDGQKSEEVTAFIQNETSQIEGEGVEHAARIGALTAGIEESVKSKREISQERKALEMTWGLEELDNATRGCFRGEFTVLGAESSGGKTAFGVQMSIANAREGTPVIWFSMEMSKEQLAKRFYPAISEIITNNHMRDPRLMNLHTHIPAMEEVSRELSRLPIDIDDTSQLRIDKLKGRIRMLCRKWRKETGSNKILCILDYLQLVKLMPKMTPLEAFNSMIFTLRDIPKDEPDIHLLALSQYSQGDKFAKKKSARTKDSLYGGSVIHQAAQNVLMISIEDQEKTEGVDDYLDAQIRIAKQREGKRGKVNCMFDPGHLRYFHPQPVLR